MSRPDPDPHPRSCGGVYRGVGNFFASTLVNLYSKREGPLETIPVQATWDLNAGYRSKRFYHGLSLKNILDERVEIPAYVRRNLNSYPAGFGRSLYYVFRVSL